jgi:predicted transcriptional regulator
MPSPDTRVITAHVPAPLAAKVDTLAERLQRSPGWVMEQALAACAEREEARRRLTLETLADVDAGRGVSRKQMKDWAASLGTEKPLPLPSCGQSGQVMPWETLGDCMPSSSW